MRFPLVLIVILLILGGFLVFRQLTRNQFDLPKGETVPLESLVSEDNQDEIVSLEGGSNDDTESLTSFGPIKSNRQIFVTDRVKHNIPLNEIISGGPPKDGIPAIDNPKFISITEASGFIRDEEPGLGLVIKGEARFYPYLILVWHEIVNDTIQGEPVLVTYCPLCATGIVFERKIPTTGEVTTFGTSGKLWQSNLLMYNRTKKGEEDKESLWSQVLGEAVVGEFTGTRLRIVLSDTIRFGEWKKLHSDTRVLSRDTGTTRPYGSNPYGDYFTSGGTIFPVANQDGRLEAKDFVLGVEINNNFKAYESGAVARAGVINDELGNIKLLVVKQPGTSFGIQEAGVVRIFERTLDGKTYSFELKNGILFDKETNSQWNFEGEAVSGPLKGSKFTQVPYIPGFWFSWVAVHPDTELFK